VQAEFVAVVHVSAPAQKATGVHVEQVEAGPELSTYLPGMHEVHCEVTAELHVTWLVQNATAGHSGQVSATPSAR